MTIYTTRDEAILREIVEPLGDEAAHHDVEAIAAQVLDAAGEGSDYHWFCTVDAGEFWAVAAEHAREDAS